mmetsp:Transcript_36574/g.60575  ORF Transcript_36574/g.60575 Transcript_36574/m.60575 type:complete len:153 (+) Transcript_36574:94-552(+)
MAELQDMIFIMNLGFCSEALLRWQPSIGLLWASAHADSVGQKTLIAAAFMCKSDPPGCCSKCVQHFFSAKGEAHAGGQHSRMRRVLYSSLGSDFGLYEHDLLELRMPVKFCNCQRSVRKNDSRETIRDPLNDTTLVEADFDGTGYVKLNFNM